MCCTNRVDPQHYAQGDYKEYVCDTMATMTSIYLVSTFLVRSFHVAKFKQNEPAQDLPPVFDEARIKVDHFVKVFVIRKGVLRPIHSSPNRHVTPLYPKSWNVLR